MEMKKFLVVGVILLFFGVAVAPSINFTVVKASNDNDLVEVTTQACGIDGIQIHTVKLTQEQYQNLQKSLTEFKERVYQTTSREEVNEVFNEFIIELHNYGLLGRLSIKQAQRLVTGFFSRYSIHGEAKDYNTLFLGLIAKIPANIINFLSKWFILIGFLGLFVDPCTYFSTSIKHKQILSNIYYGYLFQDVLDPESHWTETVPASGSVWISGPYGNKSWNGTFVGTLSYLLRDPLRQFQLKLGVIGFTGLWVYTNSTKIYFGTARKVGISSV